jgi:hypothetical protein
MVRHQPDEGHNLNVKQHRGTVLGDDSGKTKGKPPKFWVVFLCRLFGKPIFCLVLLSAHLAALIQIIYLLANLSEMENMNRRKIE